MLDAVDDVQGRKRIDSLAGALQSDFRGALSCELSASKNLGATRSHSWPRCAAPPPSTSENVCVPAGRSFDDDARAAILSPRLVTSEHASAVWQESGAIPPAPAVARNAERTDRVIRRVRERFEDHLAAIFLARRYDDCLASFIDQEEPRWKLHVAE